MAQNYHPKKLIVEGKKDLYIIPYLMEANGITWDKSNFPVFIQAHGSNDFVTASRVSAELKERNRFALGLIVDADDDLLARWRSVRNACLPSIPGIPEELPESGLIQVAQNGVRLGVWIMPDNKLRGMIETFLACLIKDESESLWQYAQTTVTEAKRRDAPFKNFHVDKAQIYTWLAWQDEPGQTLQEAIIQKTLNPKHPNAQSFVSWFRDLYDL